MCSTRCMASGETQLKLLTARSPSDILPVLWTPALTEPKQKFPCYIIILGPGARGSSLLKGFPYDMRLATCH